ncbi:MAG: GGDEF domain-containing protein, partial [Sediminispirochaetaceae bacterium]
ILSEYRSNIRSLEALLSDAIEIFNQQSIEDLITFITTHLVDRFVPQYLQFVFTPHGHEENLKTVCFHNLKKVESPAPIKSLEPYRQFFRRYPGTIGYSLFEYSIHNPHLIKQLSPLNPEIIIPVAGPEDLYGIIVVGKKVTDGEYTNEEIIYIDRLMKFVSISLQNTIHYTSSVTDYKTRLYNHSFFTKRLAEELAKVKRHGKSISILLLDIDHFKNFNDKYGHLAGDKVLFQLARQLEDSTREEDVIARFGGEEFTILLPESNLTASHNVAERIRRDIEEMEIPYLKDLLKITVSIGVNTVNSSRLDTPAKLLEQTDEALYTSKEKGRNRVTHYRAGLLFRATNTFVEEK